MEPVILQLSTSEYITIGAVIATFMIPTIAGIIHVITRLAVLTEKVANGVSAAQVAVLETKLAEAASKTQVALIEAKMNIMMFKMGIGEPKKD